ncbi:MAG: PIN domain-containing protein [Bacteroidales bacterium]|jgi:predicted nucleic acid-binding protein|nr:PIN domain-containing protein [Bacteroidota bacterium]NLN99353.1 PIN domain-containing protein [Bacteroidales bacterium]
MKIFLDTNAVLDFMIPTRKDHAAMKTILGISKYNKLEMLTSAMSLATSAYVLRDEPDYFLETTKIFRRYVGIADMPDYVVDEALKMGHSDFEDALQLVCSATECCDIIITRDKQHFTDKYTIQQIYTPAEFLAKAKASASRQT